MKLVRVLRIACHIIFPYLNNEKTRSSLVSFLRTPDFQEKITAIKEEMTVYASS